MKVLQVHETPLEMARRVILLAVNDKPSSETGAKPGK
jgi:hypothetical protein